MAWAVTRTVRVRLDVPDDRKSDLHATNDKVQYCANRTADWAWRYPDENCVTSKSEAEAAIYDDLRDETDYLHANLVQKAIKRATDDIGDCVDRLADGENTSKEGATETFTHFRDLQITDRNRRALGARKC